MAKPKKMTDKERVVSDVLIENIELLKKENGIKSDAECMRKIKEKTGFDFNQSKYSDIKQGKTFPTTMELIAFSDFFNVSIDFLLGKERHNEDLTIFESCQIIVQLFESHINLGCAPVEISETDYSLYALNNSYTQTYNAIYFSTETPPIPFYADKTRLSPHRKAEKINDFIKKMIDITNIKHTISKELYNKIVSEWLLEQKKYDKLTDADYDNELNDLPFC